MITQNECYIYSKIISTNSKKSQSIGSGYSVVKRNMIMIEAEPRLRYGDSHVKNKTVAIYGDPYTGNTTYIETALWFRLWTHWVTPHIMAELCTVCCG